MRDAVGKRADAVAQMDVFAGHGHGKVGRNKIPNAFDARADHGIRDLLRDGAARGDNADVHAVLTDKILKLRHVVDGFAVDLAAHHRGVHVEERQYAKADLPEAGEARESPADVACACDDERMLDVDGEDGADLRE